MATNNKLLVGVLIGAAAGAAIGYLLTTEKGKEILSNLQDAAGTATDRVRGAYDTAKNKMSGAYDTAKSKVTDTFGKGQQYADEMKNNI
jgi:gas vesicle protein